MVCHRSHPWFPLAPRPAPRPGPGSPVVSQPSCDLRPLLNQTMAHRAEKCCPLIQEKSFPGEHVGEGLKAQASTAYPFSHKAYAFFKVRRCCNKPKRSLMQRGFLLCEWIEMVFSGRNKLSFRLRQSRWLRICHAALSLCCPTAWLALPGQTTAHGSSATYFINNVLLILSPAQSITYCLHLLLCSRAK